MLLGRPNAAALQAQLAMCHPAVPVPVPLSVVQTRCSGGAPASLITRPPPTAQRLVQPWQMTGQNRVWWEALVLLRKAGVVLLGVLVTNPYLQCVGATLWFGGFLQLQVKYAPYTRLLFNRLELVSLTASVLTAIISTALLQYNVGMATADMHGPTAMTPIEWTVTLLLVFINMGTFLLCGCVWLWLQCRRVQGVIRRTSVRVWRRKSSGGTTTPASRLSGSVSGGRGKLMNAGVPIPATSAVVAEPSRLSDDRMMKEGFMLSSNPLRAGLASSAHCTGTSELPATSPPSSAPAPPLPVAAVAGRRESRPESHLAQQRRVVLPHTVRGSVTSAVVAGTARTVLLGAPDRGSCGSFTVGATMRATSAAADDTPRDTPGSGSTSVGGANPVDVAEVADATGAGKNTTTLEAPAVSVAPTGSSADTGTGRVPDRVFMPATTMRRGNTLRAAR